MPHGQLLLQSVGFNPLSDERVFVLLNFLLVGLCYDLEEKEGKRLFLVAIFPLFIKKNLSWFFVGGDCRSDYWGKPIFRVYGSFCKSMCIGDWI